MRLTYKSKIRKIAIAFASLIFICAISLHAFSLHAAAQDNTPESRPDYAAIHIFGDSLMDAGNIFNLTERPPSPPYAQKFSNGPLWVEQLADELKLSPALSTKVLPGVLNGKTPPPADGINFALAGSLSSDLNVSGSQLYGLQQQISSFRELSAIAPPNPDTLYLLLVGGNDYNEAVRLTPSVAALADLPEQVSDHVISAAAALIESGARHLLISNLPILGQQPYANFLNQAAPQSAALLNSLSTRHNQLLAQKLDALAVTTQAEIIPLDLAGLFSSVVDSPTRFGLTNVSDPCLVKGQSETATGSLCDNPKQFLFWDEVHPTEQGHAVIAQLAIATLAAAEPQTTSPNAFSKLGLLTTLGGGMAIAYLALNLALRESRH